MKKGVNRQNKIIQIMEMEFSTKETVFMFLMGVLIIHFAWEVFTLKNITPVANYKFEYFMISVIAMMLPRIIVIIYRKIKKAPPFD